MRRYLISALAILIILIFTVPSFALPAQVLLGIKAVEYYSDDDSCPYLYTFNGSDYVLENDIFSVARNKVNEYTDFLTSTK